MNAFEITSDYCDLVRTTFLIQSYWHLTDLHIAQIAMIPSFDRPDAGEGEDEWGHHSEPIADEKHSPQALRQMANAAVQRHDLDSALPLYTMAIDNLLEDMNKELNEGVIVEQRNDYSKEENGNQNDDSSPPPPPAGSESESSQDLMIILLCNRSVVLFRMELYQDAKNDAEEALRISQHKSAKSAFRLAKAQLALKEYEGAIETLQAAVRSIDTEIQQHSDQSKEGEHKIQTQQTLKTQLEKLLQTAQYHHLSSKNIPNPTTLSKLTTCIDPNHNPSVREFSIEQELGEGNYSRVVAVRHTVTSEKFALKIIEKKKVESLAKRQHPNVHNEIQMEKRILGDRLGLDERMVASRLRSTAGGDGDDGYCPYGWNRLVNMYHTFQDYNHLYYLMDLYVEGGDMWSMLRYQDKMVGK